MAGVIESRYLSDFGSARGVLGSCWQVRILNCSSRFFSVQLSQTRNLRSFHWKVLRGDSLLQVWLWHPAIGLQFEVKRPWTAAGGKLGKVNLIFWDFRFGRLGRVPFSLWFLRWPFHWSKTEVRFTADDVETRYRPEGDFVFESSKILVSALSTQKY